MPPFNCQTDNTEAVDRGRNRTPVRHLHTTNPGIIAKEANRSERCRIRASAIAVDAEVGHLRGIDRGSGLQGMSDRENVRSHGDIRVVHLKRRDINSGSKEFHPHLDLPTAGNTIREALCHKRPWTEMDNSIRLRDLGKIHDYVELAHS